MGSENESTAGPILVVMAAGMGSRFGGLKQMTPVGPSGETLLDYSVYDASRAGFRKVVFVVRRKFLEDFRREIGSDISSHIEVVYTEQETDRLERDFGLSVEREKPLGTGHAVICAEPFIDGPFAVINGDDFYGRRSFRVLASSLREFPDNMHSRTGFVIGFVLVNTLSKHGSVSRGVCEIDGNGYLDSIQECTAIEQKQGRIENTALNQKREFSGNEWVSMGMWGFQPSIFDGLRGLFSEYLESYCDRRDSEFFLPECVNRLLADGSLRIRILETPETWLGLTYTEDRAGVVDEIGRLVTAKNYPKNLWRPELDSKTRSR